MARFSGTILASSIPQASATSSAAYETYAGESASSLVPYGAGFNLLLQNSLEGTNPVLNLTVAPQP